MTFRNVFYGRRVFLTGHTGFKGSWLAAWLHGLGADVTGYALPPEYENSHFARLCLAQRIRHVEGDIRDAAHLEHTVREARPDFVFHLAAQPLVHRAYALPKLTLDINVGGSVNVLESVRACGTARVLIYVTSDKCYRNVETRQGYRETDELGGYDPYSASKACAELVFNAYRKSYFHVDGGVRAASVRAGNVLGGGDWSQDRIVPDCIRALLRNEPIQIRNPHAVRPWQHVLEPLRGYLLLASKLYFDDRYSGSWNFGPTQQAHRTVGELVDTVLEFWGSGSKIHGASSNGGKEAGLLYLNCDKAADQLGWRPLFDFRESVQQTVEWYKQAADPSGDDNNVWRLTQSQIDAYTKRYMEKEAVAG